MIVQTDSSRVTERSLGDLGAYIELVNVCARKRLNHPIPNGSPAHARILISKLFETARHTACIVSGKLTDVTASGAEIYGYADLIEKARQFISREGSKLSIILEREALHNGNKNRFFRSIVDFDKRKGDVLLYSGWDLLKNARLPHFMVTDALAYRFETQLANYDHEQIEAIANFGDGETARDLLNLFAMVSSHLSGECEVQRIHPGERLPA